MTDEGVVTSIVAALKGGDPPSAERLCRSALEGSPDEPDLLFLLGYALRQQGRPHAALKIFSRVVDLCPREATHWSNYATTLALTGDLDAALHAAETAVSLAPRVADNLDRLGMLQLQCRRPDKACESFAQALALTPDSIDIRLHAARACVLCRDPRAGDLLRPWRSWVPLTRDQQRNLADLLVQVGEAPSAVELLEDLARQVPEDWSSLLLLAKVYERVNRIDQAAALLERVSANAPRADDAMTHEVKIQRAQLAVRRREYAAARLLLEQTGPWGDDNDGYYFALAAACDRLGDTGATMRALEVAHALQTQELRISNPDLLEPGAPLLPHAGDRVSIADYRSWPDLKAPDADQSPVFVVGFPRSGTTLLEQMLDAHPRLQSMDERPFLNRLAAQLGVTGVDVPEDLHRLNQRNCDELRKEYVLLACGKVARNWDTRLVDKNPLNMLWLPMIQRMFPRAKIILALRHPCDVILSCYLQNFRSALLVSACRSLERLARTYVAVMENWLYHVAAFQPDYLVSRYDDLVADAPSQLARIAAFLGLDDAPSMLQFDAHAREKGFIRTPSYSQVVEPVDTRALGRWHAYRDYFEPLLPILRPILEHWGYSESPSSVGR